ncbi:leucine-rich repeat protein [Pelotomaculum terephthalicicum JT]|uniref:leucine-rich repeat protein n=1 Tax=Pelotomaculum terephthalicicum TaxID=206393 RepID=UPI001F046F47|nr:leucine-rich repeat protein [Pelotomaculum terephthalicicum]MCG9967275.1 leucine-rich repeat protein [Pelotomaculum terephthalicicum JT]
MKHFFENTLARRIHGHTCACFLLAALVFTCVLTLGPGPTDAVEFQVDHIKYEPSGTTATVSGYDPSHPGGAVTIPASVNFNSTDYQVTAVGNNAFRGNTNITSISIPDSVTSIGTNAFRQCTMLASVTLPQNLDKINDYMFQDSKALTSVTIPESVTSINKSAFKNCEALTSITIPGNVTSIGIGAFSGCKGMESVTLPQSLTVIDQNAFNGCEALTSITLPQSLPSGSLSINQSAFKGCTELISATIQANITSTGDSVFYGCTKLASITLPASVNSIGSNAFYGCEALTSITLPANVNSIGQSAFQNCKELTSIAIPESVTIINLNTFNGCAKLGSISLPQTLESIGQQAFESCKAFTSITIPENVTSIGVGAFGDCTALTSITIPESVTSLNNNMFSGCTALTSITLPQNLTSIGESCFNSCTDLTSVTLPPHLNSIGINAFKSSGLTSLTLPQSLTSVGNWAFNGCTVLGAAYFLGGQPAFGADVFKDTPANFILHYHVGNAASWSGYTTYPAQSFCTLTLDLQDGSTPAGSYAAVDSNGHIAAPTDPTLPGYTFGGWYKEASCANAFDFGSETVTGDITLYAKWTSNSSTVAVTGVSLNKTSATITVGGTDQLTAIIAPADATNQNVTWASDNSVAATVYNGLVTALAAGSANITVTTADGGYTATCAVTVQAAAGGGGGGSSTTSSIILNVTPLTVTLNTGGTQTVSASVYPDGVILSYASSSTAVATVSAEGVITAVAPGSASITVTATMDGYTTATASVAVTVANAAINGTVATPTVFPGGGAVPAGTQVTMKTATSGATIHYTLDGSTPTTGSPAYTGPVTIDPAVTLKAIAVRDGMEDSAVQTVSYTLAKPINSTTVNVSADNKDLAITQATLQLGAPTTVTVPNTVTDARISVAALMNENADGTITTGLLPALNIAASTAISATPVQVTIPAGATVSAPAEWNGIINLPSVQERDTVSVTPDAGKTASANTVIEIGFGDVPLTFDKAVRILIPGQAGKEAGYIRSGVFTKITRVLSADSQAAGDALPAGGDGKVDVDSDLVIWTKHFTKFVTYTQTATPTGGGGGGGGGSTTPQPVTSTTGSAKVTPGAGGTISLGSDAAVVVPAGALTGTSSVEVKVQKVAAPPAVPSGFKLAGSVYELSVGGKNSYSFAKSVTIKLSFDPGAVGADETPAIYYYDEALAEWVNIGGTVSGSTISVQVDHFTKFAVIAAGKDEDKTPEKPAVSLNDIAGHWAMDNINKLVALGCISGYPDGSFKPDSTITRAEFATVLVQAFKLENNGGKIFADTAAHWAKNYIAAAAANGVINGYDADTFGPDDPITREQMAVMIVKAAKLDIVTEETAFADSGSISGWAGEAVATAAKNGIIKGYPDNTVRAQGNATRAEAVTVILNALNQ